MSNNNIRTSKYCDSPFNRQVQSFYDTIIPCKGAIVF